MTVTNNQQNSQVAALQAQVAALQRQNADLQYQVGTLLPTVIELQQEGLLRYDVSSDRGLASSLRAAVPSYAVRNR